MKGPLPAQLLNKQKKGKLSWFGRRLLKRTNGIAIAYTDASRASPHSITDELINIAELNSLACCCWLVAAATTADGPRSDVPGRCVVVALFALKNPRRPYQQQQQREHDVIKTSMHSTAQHHHTTTTFQRRSNKLKRLVLPCLALPCLASNCVSPH